MTSHDGNDRQGGPWRGRSGGPVLLVLLVLAAAVWAGLWRFGPLRPASCSLAGGTCPPQPAEKDRAGGSPGNPARPGSPAALPDVVSVADTDRPGLPTDRAGTANRPNGSALADPARPAGPQPSFPAGHDRTATHPLLGRSVERFISDLDDLPGTADAAQARLLNRLLADLAAARSPAKLTIDYPRDGSIFPPEFIAPTFLWHEPTERADTWLVLVRLETGPDRSNTVALLVPGLPPPRGKIDRRCIFPSNEIYQPTAYQASARSWTPSAAVWQAIKRRSVQRPARLTIAGFDSRRPDRLLSVGSMSLTTSRDPVGAPIFYRDVPLMATKNDKGIIMPLGPVGIPLIQWRLRDVSRPDSKVLLEGMVSCANCHSFSLDGQVMGMDIDGPQGDKGAYAIAPIRRRMVIDYDDVISWNRFPGKPPGHKTIGFLSRISPDGRYAVTTVNEQVYVVNFPDYKFLQVFYPTRGILAWYDTATGRMKALPGADDPAYVHCDAVWSPDGRYLVFARAPARQAYRPGQKPAMFPNDPNETQIRYDLYRIDFNDGAGGRPQPIPGASANGMSNTFPKISPDGKWLVFVKCRNGQLMRPDSRLWIVPAQGGQARLMNCNLEVMNSWHSFSPNGRWMVFSSKANTPYTQMFLTHIDEQGNDSPAILVPNATAANRAVNLPEFVNRLYETFDSITVPAAQHIAYQVKAIELARRNQLDQAARLLGKAIDADPTYVLARQNLGVILFMQGRYEQARDQLVKAAELAPDNPSIHYHLGRVCGAMEQWDQSAEHLNRALTLAPAHVPAHYYLAVLLASRGRFDPAIDHFQQALAAYPRTEPARRRFEQEHAVLPDRDQIRLSLAGTLLAAGRTDQADRLYRQLLADRPDHPAAHYGLGLLLVRANRFKQAAGHFLQTLQAQPDHFGAHLQLGRLALMQLQLDAAQAHLTRAVELAGDDATARALLGQVLVRRRRFAQARPHLEKALALDPANRTAAQSLAWLLATSPDPALRHGERAVALAEQLYRTGGDRDPTCLDTLAAAYAEAGRFDKAVELVQRLLAMLGDAQPQAAAQLRRRLQCYQAGRPFRDVPPDSSPRP